MQRNPSFPLALVFALLFQVSNAFYLPGTAPHDYVTGEKVQLFVNALTPMLPSTDDAKLVRFPLVICNLF